MLEHACSLKEHCYLESCHLECYLAHPCMCSEVRTLLLQVSVAIMLAPVAFLGHITSQPVEAMARMETDRVSTSFLSRALGPVAAKCGQACRSTLNSQLETEAIGLSIMLVLSIWFYRSA